MRYCCSLEPLERYVLYRGFSQYILFAKRKTCRIFPSKLCQGKTTRLVQILGRSEAYFVDPPVKILWFYRYADEELFARLEFATAAPIEFVEWKRGPKSADCSLDQLVEKSVEKVRKKLPKDAQIACVLDDLQGTVSYCASFSKVRRCLVDLESCPVSVRNLASRVASHLHTCLIVTAQVTVVKSFQRFSGLFNVFSHFTAPRIIIAGFSNNSTTFFCSTVCA